MSNVKTENAVRSDSRVTEFGFRLALTPDMGGDETVKLTCLLKPPTEATVMTDVLE